MKSCESLKKYVNNLLFYWNSSSDESRSVFSLFVTLAWRGWTAARIPDEAAEAALEATEAAVVATARAAVVAEVEPDALFPGPAPPSSTQASPKESSVFRRPPAEKT